jgi:hypothetical protein
MLKGKLGIGFDGKRSKTLSFDLAVLFLAIPYPYLKYRFINERQNALRGEFTFNIAPIL